MFDRANNAHLAVVGQRLSHERFKPYEATGGTIADGLRLYEWNTAASAAMYATLQALEVVLRNALHEQLTAWHVGSGHPGAWIDDHAKVLDQRRRDDISHARQRLRAAGRPITPVRVVSELPFGFWRYILASRYHDALWIPALRHAFRHRPQQTRRQIYDPLVRLHRLRNRIAHHEPIHGRNLAKDQAEALKILSAICPVTTSWVDQTSVVPGVLAGRPLVPAQRRV